MGEEHPFEPFKFKTIQAINTLSKNERTRILKEAHYNVFKIPSEKVTIDLLTDSGTGSLSDKQWSSLMLGDEAYAYASSWIKLEDSIKKFSGMRRIIPTHQGRACEKIIAEVFLSRGDVVISNTLFDTTRANFEHKGARCIDIPSKKFQTISKPSPFKGDIDLGKLKSLIKTHKEKVKLIVMTITNNGGGGQPASLKNIEEVSKIAKAKNIPLLLDACRIAENSYFVLRDEFDGKGNIKSIIKKTFSLADVAHMSAKKDGLANIGGFIATNEKVWAEKMEELSILYEGYLTYGGMSGREMETIAEGLKEVTDKQYLEYRIGQIKYLHSSLASIGFPLIHPAGGHAVYIDAEKLLPHIPKEEFPGQALVVSLYEKGGIRAVEMGSLMFGKFAKGEFVRLALPRRTYTQSHMDYVIDVCKKIITEKKKIKGVKIAWEPKSLRHFSSKLALVK